MNFQLEVLLKTAQYRAKGVPPDWLSATSFQHQHWPLGQMVAQHSVGGCNPQRGDLLGECRGEVLGVRGG